MSDTDYPGPFTLDLVSGARGLLKQRDLAAAAMRPGDDVRDVSARVRGYVSKGYLHPVARDAADGRGALLFDPGAALTASAMLIVADTGMSNAAVMQAVAMAFQSWRSAKRAETGRTAGLRNPAGLLLAAWRDDAVCEWTLRVQFRRHVENGGKEVIATLIAGECVLGLPLHPRDGYAIEAELVIVLDAVIPLVGAMTASVDTGA